MLLSVAGISKVASSNGLLLSSPTLRSMSNHKEKLPILLSLEASRTELLFVSYGMPVVDSY